MSVLCRTILLANNVKLMSKEIVPTFSADDVAKIKKFCKTHSKVSSKGLLWMYVDFTLMLNIGALPCPSKLADM